MVTLPLFDDEHETKLLGFPGDKITTLLRKSQEELKELKSLFFLDIIKLEFIRLVQK